ncbi:alanyl-tRNA synthetase [Hydrogenoanaerobacterium saccharovorans]|uniref:Alanine--tRNA ligase n=1 Tax=Hydrogenoanaerobacterium saccharovorans TaxID=474960 RepID=A0A1H8CVI6_9FIRM|nr:alanine--tRNA ligase [Hydrogenoanaerobacterium saccharovorans]RPF43331.1 alanyl-tRNA synthetase [Hydrogenoanaerobacterium saccharovorans]SEM98892.1 alanyl-tRNA synthetase [Hydrogenoanaerobacterium saccharovorans]
MKWMGLNEIREKYLSFFESKGHTRLPSFPLIPIDDNSLLLINSGMAPMKKFFLGQAVPPNKRVTTCQKCIRTPDIENVGKTARHGTFFEMLGNFSFGDYFKVEATAWAWEFLTKVMEMPEDRLWVTIYEDDDEAFEIWTKKVGISAEKIVRMGKEDNFWEIGSGPCGPCSEIHWDRGPEFGCGKPGCALGCDCDRYMEVWNLVFSQFDGDGKGNYERLEHPNIDTGMGLERLACVMQGVNNLFEVDTVQNIMQHIRKIAGVEYGKEYKTDVSLRVITDHIRSTVFMIGDGVIPSNEGRGYVLRRLLRRAARHGRLLNINEPFLYKVCETVIKENETAYPELIEKKDYIQKVIKVEEDRFAKTIDMGMEMLNNLMDKLSADSINGKLLSGEEAFKLYDTFGFPIDLTKEIIAERGIEVDEDEFKRLMNDQRDRARTARLSGNVISWADDIFADLKEEHVNFTGYAKLADEGSIIAMVKDGEMADSMHAGDKGTIILDQTPFYAESGGQIGDTGVLKLGDNLFHVYETKKTATGLFLHNGEMASGMLTMGNKVTAIIDDERRRAIMRNHTAAHLLQKALIDVLGNHVQQAGQLVDEGRVRFDFTHFSAMTPDEIKRVEDIVNGLIMHAYDVCIKEMPIKEAKEMGATALFGEKYGDVVRVVNVSNESIELCGGTHVSNTSKIGLFKIISESSVAAGVRRIEAATGLNVLELFNENQDMMLKTAENLKASNPHELVAKSAQVMAELKDKIREIEEINVKIAEAKSNELFAQAKEVCGVKYICASFTGTKPEAIRAMCDKIKAEAPNMVGVISTVTDGKASIFASCGKNTIEKGMHAGKLIKAICEFVGGKGGGRPDSAQGGATELFKIDEAFAQVPSLIEEMVGKK